LGHQSKKERGTKDFLCVGSMKPSTRISCHKELLFLLRIKGVFVSQRSRRVIRSGLIFATSARKSISENISAEEDQRGEKKVSFMPLPAAFNGFISSAPML